MKDNRNKIIDSIKGIACMIVLFAHIVASNHSIGKYANGCGKIGVWCFMIMSGFLSIWPYISGIKDCEGYNIKYVLKYYCKKIFTLYPAFVLALLLGIYTGRISNIRVMFRHLFCVESIDHFWYMIVIIKFYILFPLFVFLLKALKDNKTFYGILIGLMMIVTSVLFPYTSCPGNSNLLRYYIPVFCMGMIMALIYNWVKDNLSNKLFFDVLCLVFVCVVIACTPWGREKLWGIAPSTWLQNKYLLMGALWSGIILCVLLSKYIKVVFVKCKIFLWISAISYEIYLIHYIVLMKLNLMVSDFAYRSLLVVIISIVLSVLIHYTILGFGKCISNMISSRGNENKN